MTIQRRTLHGPAVGVLLLVSAYALPGPGPGPGSTPGGAPLGHAATVLGAAASVWEDGDLRFEREDLARAERHWRGEVRGLALLEEGAGEGDPVLVYARSIVYPLVAAPAYGLLGPRGLRVLNAALFLAVLWVAWWLIGHPRGCRKLPRSGLFLLGFFFASAALAHVLAMASTAFEMACVFVALALWCRVRERPLWGRRELLPVAGAGVLVACAFAAQPALGLFALPPAVDLLWSRRWKAAAAFALAALLAGFGLVRAQEAVTGDVAVEWDWGVASRAEIFDDRSPFEDDRARPERSGERVALPAEDAPGSATGESEPTRSHPFANAWYLLVGRHAGLLPYFPFALFALGLYVIDLRRSGGRTRHLMAVTLAVYGGLLALRLPEAAAAPAGPGLAALAAVYPVFLFLPWRLRAGTAVLAPFVAAGLWTVPALVGAVRPPGPEAVFELHARGAAFRPLPLETTLLARGRLPGYARWERPAEQGAGVWLVPRETFFLAEGNERGAWVRGASRSEIYVAVPGPDAALPEIRLRLGSVSADNVVTLTGADERIVVRFDSAAKRSGTPVSVRPEPVASLDVFGDAEPERIGRLVVESSHGAVPARINRQSSDTRYLGVFLGLEPSGSPL